jgi:demethoxyubiquinone hydroxylase (CLK1/Coq7/Cat5 family)
MPKIVTERPKLSLRDALTIARIVRVNHAGEYGAIRIYGAQIGVSGRRFPDVLPALADMLQHEKKHCAAFFAAMPARQSRPCRIMSLWSLGGWLLGFATALMGTPRDLDLHRCGRSGGASPSRRPARVPRRPRPRAP